MDSSFGSKSQGKMRKGLRSRRTSVVLADPKKSKHGIHRADTKVVHFKSSEKKTPKGLSEKLKKSTRAMNESQKSTVYIENSRSDEKEGNTSETTEIGVKFGVKQKTSSNAMPADRSDGENVESSPKSESTIGLDNEQNNNDSDPEAELHRNDNDNPDDEANLSGMSETLERDYHENDSEDLDDGCVETVLKEFNKDIAALYSKTNRIESDIKEIKKLLTARPSQGCIRPISSRLKQKSEFSLLPKFPLLKKSAARKMNASVEEEDEDNDYKDQLIKKLASYGGRTVNELVINIFKKLFSSKLKTKYCWKGSLKGKGKAPFKALLGIRDAIWSAVKVHFKDCTEATINKEFKLRLNQAQKDYDREMLKANPINE